MVLYIYIVSDNKCLLKHKIIINSVYIQKFHGYLIGAAYKCLDTINMLEWHDGSHRNGHTAYAGRGIPGKKIYDKASNSQVRWDLIKNFTNQIYEYDQELANCNNEITIKNHKHFEGQLIKKEIVIGKRSIPARDAYLETYGFNCKLCGKHYLKSDGTNHIIDVHHLNPIASGERGTDIDKDLVGLCPNCHRFVHSIKDFEKKDWKEIEDIFRKVNNK